MTMMAKGRIITEKGRMVVMEKERMMMRKRKMKMMTVGQRVGEQGLERGRGRAAEQGPRQAVKVFRGGSRYVERVG